MTAYAPLTEMLTGRHGYPLLGEQDLDAFTRDAPYAVLFFQGDWQRLGESGDVAVILPELVKAFDGLFKPAVIDRAAERRLQARFRFPAFPALVFLRGSGYLGAISRVLDWNDYLLEIAAILEREPSEPPPFRLPEPPAHGAGGEPPHIH